MASSGTFSGGVAAAAKPPRRARDKECVALEAYLRTALMHDTAAAVVKEVNKYLLRVSNNGA